MLPPSLPFPRPQQAPSSPSMQASPDCPGAQGGHTSGCRVQTAGPSRRLSDRQNRSRRQRRVAADRSRQVVVEEVSCKAIEGRRSNQRCGSSPDPQQGAPPGAEAAGSCRSKNPFELGHPTSPSNSIELNATSVRRVVMHGPRQHGPGSRRNQPKAHAAWSCRSSRARPPSRKAPLRRLVRIRLPCHLPHRGGARFSAGQLHGPNGQASAHDGRRRALWPRAAVHRGQPIAGTRQSRPASSGQINTRATGLKDT